MVETGAIEEEASEILEAALGIEVDGEGEGEEVGAGTLRELRAIEFLTQDADPRGKTIVDARNGFNDMSRLEMLWSVRYCWAVWTRFALNLYRPWAQLLLRHPGEPSVTIII